LVNEANILIISEKTDAKWILIFRQKNKRTKKKAKTNFPVISLELILLFYRL